MKKIGFEPMIVNTQIDLQSTAINHSAISSHNITTHSIGLEPITFSLEG